MAEEVIDDASRLPTHFLSPAFSVPGAGLTSERSWRWLRSRRFVLGPSFNPAMVQILAIWVLRIAIDGRDAGLNPIKNIAIQAIHRRFSFAKTQAGFCRTAIGIAVGGLPAFIHRPAFVAAIVSLVAAGALVADSTDSTLRTHQALLQAKILCRAFGGGVGELEAQRDHQETEDAGELSESLIHFSLQGHLIGKSGQGRFQPRIAIL
ncbi:MAG: hypothetical protein COT73_11895 [Bdellovibrio sp. CG10_big_fil_rev_8_21_14_0_10_47_8]|nr:MAG: hypothetical protein COT73_11895 [Bdellovibrio sp. CG10_big_fil_rev_8_21_14_0_10_47_8]